MPHVIQMSDGSISRRMVGHQFAIWIDNAHNIIYKFLQHQNYSKLVHSVKIIWKKNLTETSEYVSCKIDKIIQTYLRDHNKRQNVSRQQS